MKASTHSLVLQLVLAMFPVELIAHHVMSAYSPETFFLLAFWQRLQKQFQESLPGQSLPLVSPQPPPNLEISCVNG